MPIYVVRAGEHGPVKIGFTKDVASRLVKMQADNHERLTILGVFTGGAAEELALHRRFAGHRLRGEWFSFSPAMLGDLGLKPLEMPGKRQKKPANDIITALGGPVQLSRDLGIYRPVPTTLHWRRRGIPSRYWHRITELAAARGLVLTARDLERMLAYREAA